MAILHIGPGSDGIGNAPPDITGWWQDDAHYLERIGAMWAKETGTAGSAHRLDQLPAGYSGWAKPRAGDTNHVDRYLYGHPSGKVFRSNNEIWPHFKHLQDYGGSVGCPCTLCTGKKPASTRKRPSASNPTSSGSPSRQSGYFAAASSKPAIPVRPQRADPKFLQHLPQGRLTSDSPTPAQRRKQVDAEGTVDLYRSFFDKLQAAAPESVSENVIDSMSPDYRAGNEMLHGLFAEWSTLPSYVPRLGEIVVFARNVLDEGLAWDKSTQTLRRVYAQNLTWLDDKPRWEVGVVTQTPEEQITPEDLLRVPSQKRQNVTYSGFRIEPLSYSKQHKYVPLHAIRPFTYWRECLGSKDTEWPATLKHAMTVASSFCILGRYSFKGTWPTATLFARGLYLGPEMIMVGDLVRFLPNLGEKRDSVADVMAVTSIRLCFANLDEASNDDYDHGENYVIALHVCGRAFTLNPKRSFGGIAKSPVAPGQRGAPQALAGFGTWFHLTDPNNDKAKLEVPFQRIMGRFHNEAAVRAWFAPPNSMLPPSTGSFQAVNMKPETAKILDLSRGLAATKSARQYSLEHDSRIDRAANKSWFWAETRIEQLDLQEINGRYVGVKDENRTRKSMNSWRQALKVMDGKRGGVEAYNAAREQRQADERRRESAAVPGSSWGLMAAGALQANSSDQEEIAETDAEENENVPSGDAMEVDDDQQISSARAGASNVIDLSAETDDDELA